MHVFVICALAVIGLTSSPAAEPPVTQAELKSLQGKITYLLSDEEGIVFEFWAKSDNFKTVFKSGGQTIISIQKGKNLYTYIEGSNQGTRQTFHHGLAAMGLLKQIKEVKERGKLVGTETIDGVEYGIYNYDLNAPAEMALVYLSSEASIPRLWISVRQTGEETGEALRMSYSDLESNIDIADEMFSLPENIVFEEEVIVDNSQDAASLEIQQQETPDVSTNDTSLMVVITPSAKIMSVKAVLDTRAVGDTLHISRSQNDWLYVDKPGTKGWINKRDVIALNEAKAYFTAAIDRDPRDTTALLGRGNHYLFMAKHFTSLQQAPKETIDSFLDAAWQDFNQALEVTPSVEAWVGKGLVSNMREEFHEAISNFDQALQIDATDTTAMRHRVTALINNDEASKAISDCDQILKITGKDAETLSLRCYALGLKGEWDEAMLACNSAIEYDPQLASAYMRRGTIWAKIGDQPKADADFEKASQLNLGAILDAKLIISSDSREMKARNNSNIKLPSDEVLRNAVYEVANSLGWSLAYEDPAEGIFVWRLKVMSLTRPGWEARFVWYMKRVDGELAVAAPIALLDAEDSEDVFTPFVNRLQEQFIARWLSIVGEVNLREADASTHLSESLSEAVGKSFQSTPIVAGDEVFVSATNAVIRGDAGLVSSVPRGVVLTVRGFQNDGLKVAYQRAGVIARDSVIALDTAIDMLTKAIAKDPGLAVLYSLRGNVYSALGDFEKALTDHDKALKLQDLSTRALHWRGLAYARSGNHQKANQDFNAAIDLDPEDPLLFLDRGVLFLLNGQYDRALADLTESVRLDPLNSGSQMSRASALEALGKMDEALQGLDEAVRLDSDNADAYFNRCRIFGQTGEYDKSAADYRRAIELNPKYLGALEDPANLQPK